MSQQSTFLYWPHTRIRSSRPDAWSVQDVIQAGRSVRLPSPGKASAPLHMRVDTSSYAGACVVRPSGKSPIKGGTFASVSQSAFDSWVVNNPGPSWDFCPGLLCLAQVPFAGENYLVSIGYYLAPEVWGGLQLTVATSIRLPLYTDSGKTALANWSLIWERPA